MIEPKGKVRGKTDGALRSEPNTKKRKLDSTLSICVRCDEVFQEGARDRCRYHDGELEPDYDGDFWADHDERCHGTIDTDIMREDFPDGFIWNCCDKLGSEPGCRKGYHESNPDKKCEYYESGSEDNGTSENGSEKEDEDEEAGDEDAGDDQD